MMTWIPSYVIALPLGAGCLEVEISLCQPSAQCWGDPGKSGDPHFQLGTGILNLSSNYILAQLLRYTISMKATYLFNLEKIQQSCLLVSSLFNLYLSINLLPPTKTGWDMYPCPALCGWCYLILNQGWSAKGRAIFVQLPKKTWWLIIWNLRP